MVSTLSNTGVTVIRVRGLGARNASDSCLFSVRFGTQGSETKPSSRGGNAANKRLGDTAEITDMLGKSRAQCSGDGVLLTSSGQQSRPIKPGRSWVLGTKLKYVTNYPVMIMMVPARCSAPAHCRLLGTISRNIYFVVLIVQWNQTGDSGSKYCGATWRSVISIYFYLVL